MPGSIRLPSQPVTLSEDTLSYGVMFDTTNSSPIGTRIGNMKFHASLPIQSKMKGCLLDNNGNVTQYLPSGDWSSSTLDGSAGQVMIEIPQYYYKATTSGNTISMRISEYPISGYTFNSKRYISAYEASLQRSTSMLSSVVNTTTDYRGGNNTSSWDGTYRSLLGRPVTNLSRTSFRTYARNRGSVRWNQLDYTLYKDIVWLYIIEYNNLNSQATYNSSKDAYGCSQGGLDNGITNISFDWNSYNTSNPFCPCGITNSLGNSTGLSAYNIINSSGTTQQTVYANRYRGIENIFGHVWKWTDGINIAVLTDSDGGTSTLYTCNTPNNYSDSSYSYYQNIGLISRTQGYVNKMIFSSNGDIIPTNVSGSSSTYWCDYFYNNITASQLYGVLFGGASSYVVSAGLAFANSINGPSGTYASIGSRLCFI